MLTNLTFCSDFGFEEDDGNTVCLPSDQFDVHWGTPYPCPAGNTYVVSLGYRKINGDKCVGGEENDFLPRAYICPSMLISCIVITAEFVTLLCIHISSNSHIPKLCIYMLFIYSCLHHACIHAYIHTVYVCTYVHILYTCMTYICMIYYYIYACMHIYIYIIYCSMCICMYVYTYVRTFMGIVCAYKCINCDIQM